MIDFDYIESLDNVELVNLLKEMESIVYPFKSTELSENLTRLLPNTMNRYADLKSVVQFSAVQRFIKLIEEK
jgi:hypothetical protein